MKNTKAIEKVHSVIAQLKRDDNSPVSLGTKSAPQFETVSITTNEAEALRGWVVKENAKHTIEIGLAFGFSALHICEGLLAHEQDDAKHVAIDAFQSQHYRNFGLEILSKAGLGELIEFHEEKSQVALPSLWKEGRQFDFAFVDGNHRFDYVFLDLFYLGHLVKKGGVIFLDDYNYPGIKKAATFFINNLGWKIEENESDKNHEWAVLRTSEKEDARDFTFFKNF